MWFPFGNPVIIVILLSFYFCEILCTKYMGRCGILSDQNDEGNKSKNMGLKLERLRALCNAIQWSQAKSNNENLDSLPDFDLTRINTGKLIYVQFIRDFNQFSQRKKWISYCKDFVDLPHFYTFIANHHRHQLDYHPAVASLLVNMYFNISPSN